MKEKTPIAMIIDDSCPLVHTMYESAWVKKNDLGQPVNEAGELLKETIPNDFVRRFCDVADRWGLAGKLSVVPMPKGKGDIVNGIPGYPYALVQEWIDLFQTRLAARFAFSPEILTHMYALDLETGEFTDLDEETWSFRQDRTGLTPYIAKAFSLLKAVGIDATGVTSPWCFGLEVEEEYKAAIAAAQEQVYGRRFSWYFLHCLEGKPGSKPWIALEDGDRTLVSIPSTLNDKMWQTIDNSCNTDEFVSSIADGYLTADGKDGDILKVLDAGGWPLLCTHWQSLFSNGQETGLKVLSLVGERVQKHLSHRVVWCSADELAQRTRDSR